MISPAVPRTVETEWVFAVEFPALALQQPANRSNPALVSRAPPIPQTLTRTHMTQGSQTTTSEHLKCPSWVDANAEPIEDYAQRRILRYPFSR